MKLKMTCCIFSLAALIVVIPAVQAQAVYAAKQSFRIQAGGGVMYLNNDYSQKGVGGFAIWGDVDLKEVKHVLVGAEIEYHNGSIITPGDIGENTYLFGPRFTFYQKHKFAAYGKVLFGRGTITNQLFNLSSSYNILPAYGGGVEYRLTRHLNIRAIDIELQKWPDFEPNTLSPLSYTVGASYIIR